LFALKRTAAFLRWPEDLSVCPLTTIYGIIARFSSTWTVASRNAVLNPDRLEWIARRLWLPKRWMPDNAAILRHGSRYDLRRKKMRWKPLRTAAPGSARSSEATLEATHWPRSSRSRAVERYSRSSHAVEYDLSTPDHAPATERAYAHDWADFAAFCGRHGLAPLPAALVVETLLPPERQTVPRLAIATHRRSRLRPSETIQRAVSAIPAGSVTSRRFPCRRNRTC